MLRNIAIVLGIVVAFASIFIIGAFTSVAITTADAITSAENFLALINRGDPHKAYMSGSPDLQNAQSENQFRLQFAALGQEQLKVMPWYRQTLPQSGITLLEASSSDNARFVIEAVHTDEWRVRSITNWTQFNVGPGVWFRAVPLDSQIQDLVKETLLEFNIATLSDDFDTFLKGPNVHSSVGQSNLSESFETLANSGSNFNEITNLTADLADDPDWQRIRACQPFGGCKTIVTTSISVKGHYNLDPTPLTFRLFYTYIHPKCVLGCTQTVRPCTVELTPEKAPNAN